jgi:hypothetical protein
MKFYFFIFVLFLQISLFYSFLNPDDFCQKDTINMKKCMAHDCERQFCTLNKQECKSFIAWGTLMKKYAKEPKVYTAFIKNIKPCSKIEYRNQWSHRLHFG